MNNVTNLQPEKSLSSGWWLKESSLLGKLACYAGASLAIFGGIYLIARMIMLPSVAPPEMMSSLGMAGYMGISLAVVIMLAIPSILFGGALLIIGKRQTITPLFFCLLLMAAAVVFGGTRMMIKSAEARIAADAVKVDAFIRHRSIDEFVDRMRLDEKSRKDMLKMIEAMPDASLCTASILPESQCLVRGNNQ